MILSLQLGGLPGRARIQRHGRMLGCAYHGQWASHSGFHHELLCPDARLDTLFEGALELYARAAQAPYLVGAADHPEWHDIHSIGKENPRFRLPAWTAPVLTDTLRALGFTECDPANHVWTCAAPCTANELRLALAPLRAPGTRLRDPHALAAELRRHVQGSRLWFATRQGDLFDGFAA